MEENIYLETLKKVRSIPVGRLVFSRKQQKWLKFLRIVTYGQHQGTVFFSGDQQPVSDIYDIIPFANAGWTSWENAPHLFNIYDKIIDTDGRIIPWSSARYDPSCKFLSFAMKPEQYIDNIIPGELLFIRIKGMGNYIVRADSTTDDSILLTSFKGLDCAPYPCITLTETKDNRKLESIRIKDIEFIRPAVRREENMFYGISQKNPVEETKHDANIQFLKRTEPKDILYVRLNSEKEFIISDFIYDAMTLYVHRGINANPELKYAWEPPSEEVKIKLSDITKIRHAYREEVEIFNSRFLYILNASSEELKPFKTKVLVADEPGDFWLPAVFGTIIKTVAGDRYAVVGGQQYKRCIVYKGENKKLLGTQVKLRNL